ncbi:MAG: hypothetical protein IBX50_19565, partial [Marinospirillum sp.]|uniref:hypothetical protein n=1 Tax=Marinospirillum sp. TaxID=2183934 RepID=UPI001A055A48
MNTALAGETSDYFSNFYRIPVAAVGEVFTTDMDKLKRNALALGAVGLVYTQDEAIREHWMDTYTGRAMDKV